MLFQTCVALGAVLSLAQAKPTPTVLQYDDVIVAGKDGSVVVMKDYEYELKEARETLQRRKADAARSADQPESHVNHRRCDESVEYQVLSDTNFNDWDVPMSPVIGNIGSTGASVAVSKGYTVADSAYGNNIISRSFLEKLLGVEMPSGGTWTWTTKDDQTFTFQVPQGQYGLVVSNPYVRRVTGNYVSGCVDSPSYDPWQITTHTTQEYTNMQWVAGPIRLCNNTAYPIPYCVGTGTHA
ncbi:hypothetical protein J7T55_013117 [Diaporthe amygdali]|uniref:uncharacterized protein n=1 Tax=Phomopsis amygdali TaxID=1214568 RepID=UPI0022FE1661|nr:uncharacterized protein J7T55_013117 [Diaporthe amygdali]KAJ0118861.1 hypothetical protein J7T55_013117 [Diaporthe amygdali]